jgi:GDP-L-fucose synthase
VFDASKPDGTPRKLMDVGLLDRTGWRAPTVFATGLSAAYQDALGSQTLGIVAP